MLTNTNEGLMELCDGEIRSGLCYEDFTMETAIVLCRQQGFNAGNPGIRLSNIIQCTGLQFIITKFA